MHYDSITPKAGEQVSRDLPQAERNMKTELKEGTDRSRGSATGLLPPARELNTAWAWPDPLGDVSKTSHLWVLPVGNAMAGIL